MSSRDRTLALLLIGFILLGGGGAAGYVFAWEPIQEKRSRGRQACRGGGQTRGGNCGSGGSKKTPARLAVDRRRSLPAETRRSPAASTAEMMTRLLDRARKPRKGFRVTDRPTDTSGIPTLAAKKPAYTRVAFDIEFQRRPTCGRSTTSWPGTTTG